MEPRHGEKPKYVQRPAVTEYDARLEKVPTPLQTEPVQFEVYLDDSPVDEDLKGLEDWSHSLRHGPESHVRCRPQGVR